MTQRWKTLILTISLILSFISTVNATEKHPIIILTPSDDVQDHIDHAPSGAILLLSPGSYNQTFRITKQIHITSTDPNQTFINVTTDQNKPAITISTSYVHLSNVTIQNNGPGLYTTGVRVLKDHVNIENCVFQNTPIGISIWSNNNTINNCTFLNCSDEGIVLLTTAYSTANYNTISQCIFKNNCDAIELQRSCHNVINDCIMIQNTHSGIDAIISDNDHNIVSNCTITHNTVHGIYFTNSKENKILNCRIEKNTDGNIVTPDSKNTTILHPQFTTTSSIESAAENKNNEPRSTQNPTDDQQHIIISMLTRIMLKIREFFINQ